MPVPTAAAPAAGQKKRPVAQAQPTGVAAGVAVGSAAGAAITLVPAVPAIAAAQAVSEVAVTAAFVAFLASMRADQEVWIRERLDRVPMGQQEKLEVVGFEAERQTAYERRVWARVARDAATVETITEPKKRARAVRGLVDRERRFAKMRSESMAIRVAAAQDRAVLQQESPEGAFWRLDPNVKRHTRDCVAMAGKFWPWQVLRAFHPPTHAGCQCSLHSKLVAMKRGWMTAADVMDLETARVLAAKAKAMLDDEEEH